MRRSIMSQILSKTIIKIDERHHRHAVITLLFVLEVKVQLLTNFSSFRGIRLKFGGGVNSEILIPYLMSYKMNLIKIKGFMSFFIKFVQPLFIYDDMLIKATTNNDPLVNIKSQKVSAL